MLDGINANIGYELILSLGAFLLSMFLTPIYTDFAYKQFNIYGLSCQYIKLGLSDGISDAQAEALYANYTKLRNDKRGEDSGEVEMYIYTPDTIYFVNKDGVSTDVQTPVEILEPTETSK